MLAVVLFLLERAGRRVLANCATAVHGKGPTQRALHSVCKSAVTRVSTTSSFRANEITFGFVVVDINQFSYGDTRHI